MEAREEMGDGRANRWSAIGDRTKLLFHCYLMFMARFWFFAGLNSIYPLKKAIDNWAVAHFYSS